LSLIKNFEYRMSLTRFRISAHMHTVLPYNLTYAHISK
jgi:hypothetical protein